MTRANRLYLPGQVWHLTHRCHDRQHLLKLKRDRDCYRTWLFQAVRRYSLCLINYMITCNHIHLLVFDKGVTNSIDRSMQLVQGRVAQQYNRRKHRLGAFWQDRYHATAIESGEHLRRCMSYVDLNMVRAGVVNHPADWAHCGFNEIQEPRQRYRILDLQKAAELLGLPDHAALAAWQREAVTERLNLPAQREPVWTESLAVSNGHWLAAIAQALHIHTQYRCITDNNGTVALKEPPLAYGRKTAPKRGSKA